MDMEQHEIMVSNVTGIYITYSVQCIRMSVGRWYWHVKWQCRVSMY